IIVMRLYFLSERTAALKLNGAYLGIIDGFERFVDVDGGAKILAEIVPDGDAMPLSFFIDDKLFSSPPDFLDVYLSGGDAVVYVSRFDKRQHELKVVAQTEFRGGQYTLFLTDGRVYLNCEKSAECSLYELPASCANAALTESKIGGFPVLLAEGDGYLTVISEDGKRVFYNAAESWECGDKLTIKVNFNTCAECAATCTFCYDGTAMTLEGSRTEERVPPSEKILHFAFFESILTRGDYIKYLGDELKESAAALPEFLGEFVDVTVPYSRFYDAHPEAVHAAGLVYPVKKNLFNIKYFAVDIADGKITNVYEI
ncbi:MAG: hypothetical protein K2O81_04355, partial [Clostridia bacterium]|nr:hypothetical protein [Clostridia bacterium]